MNNFGFNEEEIIDAEIVVDEDKKEENQEVDELKAEMEKLQEEMNENLTDPNELIEKALEEISVEDIDGIEKEDIKNLLTGKESLDETLKKIYNGMAVKALDEHPSLLNLFKEKVFDDGETIYNPVSIKYNDKTYILLDKFLEEELPLKINFNGETKIKSYYHFKLDLVSSELKNIKQYDDKIDEKIFTDLLFTLSSVSRKEFLKENLLKANLSVNENYYKVDTFIEIFEDVFKNNYKNKGKSSIKTTIGFYREKLKKSMKKLKLADDLLEQLMNQHEILSYIVTQMNHSEVPEDSVDILSKYLDIIKLTFVKYILNTLNENNASLLITYLYINTALIMNSENMEVDKEHNEIYMSSGLDSYLISLNKNVYKVVKEYIKK